MDSDDSDVGSPLHKRLTSPHLAKPEESLEQQCERVVMALPPVADLNKLSLSYFLEMATEHGIRLTDTRYQEFMERKKKLPDVVDQQTFVELLDKKCLTLLRATQGRLIIPKFRDLTKVLEDLFEQCKDNYDGEIPEVPDLEDYCECNWGCSCCSVDGQYFSQGESNPFEIYGCIKPLLYSLAMVELGVETVHKYIGYEPSGQSHYALILNNSGLPHNPLMNTGSFQLLALLITKVYAKLNTEETFNKILGFVERLSGDKRLRYREDVFDFKMKTGFRNYAVAYMMMAAECYPNPVNVEEIIELYSKIVSIEVSCEVLAVISATYANGGVCPITCDRVMPKIIARHTMSALFSCGMYDFSGRFSFQVGLPGKASMAGALMLIVPGTIGLGVWSPRVNTFGITCRGLQFAQLLSAEYMLHPFSQLGYSALMRADLTYLPQTMTDSVTIHLQHAAARGDINALQSYQKFGTNMSQKDYDNKIPLHEAAGAGHLICVKFLIEKCNADPNTQDRHGYTPLEYAKNRQRDDVVAYLEGLPSSCDKSTG